jgi:endonuclease YncB( thermonuclease family)
LSINRPRRIFRSGLPHLDAKGLAVLLGAGLIAAAGVSLAMLPRRDAAPVPPAEELSAQPSQVAVVDAGTLRLGDRVVRLQGIEPPPRGTTCIRDDSGGEDCAAAASNALAALVREAQVACRITGEDRLGRPYAICRAGGSELNRAVVAAGWARADQAQPELKQAEAAARAGRLGVWATGANRGR